MAQEPEIDTVGMLRGARLDVVNARKALRAAEYAEKAERALAELRAINRICLNTETGEIDPKRLGANAEERVRTLTWALDSDVAYGEVRVRLLTAQAELDEAEAHLAMLLDVRRASEWEVRSRLVALLEAGGELPTAFG